MATIQLTEKGGGVAEKYRGALMLYAAWERVPIVLDGPTKVEPGGWDLAPESTRRTVKKKPPSSAPPSKLKKKKSRKAVKPKRKKPVKAATDASVEDAAGHAATASNAALGSPLESTRSVTVNGYTRYNPPLSAEVREGEATQDGERAVSPPPSPPPETEGGPSSGAGEDPHKLRPAPSQGDGSNATSGSDYRESGGRSADAEAAGSPADADAGVSPADAEAEAEAEAGSAEPAGSPADADAAGSPADAEAEAGSAEPAGSPTDADAAVSPADADAEADAEAEAGSAEPAGSPTDADAAVSPTEAEAEAGSAEPAGSPTDADAAVSPADADAEAEAEAEAGSAEPAGSPTDADAAVSPADAEAEAEVGSDKPAASIHEHSDKATGDHSRRGMIAAAAKHAGSAGAGASVSFHKGGGGESLGLPQVKGESKDAASDGATESLLNGFGSSSGNPLAKKRLNQGRRASTASSGRGMSPMGAGRGRGRGRGRAGRSSFSPGMLNRMKDGLHPRDEDIKTPLMETIGESSGHAESGTAGEDHAAPSKSLPARKKPPAVPDKIQRPNASAGLADAPAQPQATPPSYLRMQAAPNRFVATVLGVHGIEAKGAKGLTSTPKVECNVIDGGEAVMYYQPVSTKPRSKTLTPDFSDETFVLPLQNPDSVAKFTIWHAGKYRQRFLGAFLVRAGDFVGVTRRRITVALNERDGLPQTSSKVRGQCDLQCQFDFCEEAPAMMTVIPSRMLPPPAPLIRVAVRKDGKAEVLDRVEVTASGKVDEPSGLAGSPMMGPSDSKEGSAGASTARPLSMSPRRMPPPSTGLVFGWVHDPAAAGPATLPQRSYQVGVNASPMLLRSTVNEVRLTLLRAQDLEIKGSGGKNHVMARVQAVLPQIASAIESQTTAAGTPASIRGNGSFGSMGSLTSSPSSPTKVGVSAWGSIASTSVVDGSTDAITFDSSSEVFHIPIPMDVLQTALLARYQSRKYYRATSPLVHVGKGQHQDPLAHLARPSVPIARVTLENKNVMMSNNFLGSAFIYLPYIEPGHGNVGYEAGSTARRASLSTQSGLGLQQGTERATLYLFEKDCITPGYKHRGEIDVLLDWRSVEQPVDRVTRAEASISQPDPPVDHDQLAHAHSGAGSDSVPSTVTSASPGGVRSSEDGAQPPKSYSSRHSHFAGAASSAHALALVVRLAIAELMQHPEVLLRARPLALLGLMSATVRDEDSRDGVAGHAMPATVVRFDPSASRLVLAVYRLVQDAHNVLRLCAVSRSLDRAARSSVFAPDVLVELVRVEPTSSSSSQVICNHAWISSTAGSRDHWALAGGHRSQSGNVTSTYRRTASRNSYLAAFASSGGPLLAIDTRGVAQLGPHCMSKALTVSVSVDDGIVEHKSTVLLDLPIVANGATGCTAQCWIPLHPPSQSTSASLARIDLSSPELPAHMSWVACSDSNDTLSPIVKWMALVRVAVVPKPRPLQDHQDHGVRAVKGGASTPGLTSASGMRGQASHGHDAPSMPLSGIPGPVVIPVSSVKHEDLASLQGMAADRWSAAIPRPIRLPWSNVDEPFLERFLYDTVAYPSNGMRLAFVKLRLLRIEHVAVPAVLDSRKSRNPLHIAASISYGGSLRAQAIAKAFSDAWKTRFYPMYEQRMQHMASDSRDLGRIYVRHHEGGVNQAYKPICASWRKDNSCILPVLIHESDPEASRKPVRISLGVGGGSGGSAVPICDGHLDICPLLQSNGSDAYRAFESQDYDLSVSMCKPTWVAMYGGVDTVTDYSVRSHTRGVALVQACVIQAARSGRTRTNQAGTAYEHVVFSRKLHKPYILPVLASCLQSPMEDMATVMSRVARYPASRAISAESDVSYQVAACLGAPPGVFSYHDALLSVVKTKRAEQQLDEAGPDGAYLARYVVIPSAEAMSQVLHAMWETMSDPLLPSAPSLRPVVYGAVQSWRVRIVLHAVSGIPPGLHGILASLTSSVGAFTQPMLAGQDHDAGKPIPPPNFSSSTYAHDQRVGDELSSAAQTFQALREPIEATSEPVTVVGGHEALPDVCVYLYTRFSADDESNRSTGARARGLKRPSLERRFFRRLPAASLVRLVPDQRTQSSHSLTTRRFGLRAPAWVNLVPDCDVHSKDGRYDLVSEVGHPSLLLSVDVLPDNSGAYPGLTGVTRSEDGAAIAGTGGNDNVPGHPTYAPAGDVLLDPSKAFEVVAKAASLILSDKDLNVSPKAVGRLLDDRARSLPVDSISNEMQPSFDPDFSSDDLETAAGNRNHPSETYFWAQVRVLGGGFDAFALEAHQRGKDAFGQHLEAHRYDPSSSQAYPYAVFSLGRCAYRLAEQPMTDASIDGCSTGPLLLSTSILGEDPSWPGAAARHTAMRAVLGIEYRLPSPARSGGMSSMYATSRHTVAIADMSDWLWPLVRKLNDPSSGADDDEHASTRSGILEETFLLPMSVAGRTALGAYSRMDLVTMSAVAATYRAWDLARSGYSDVAAARQTISRVGNAMVQLARSCPVPTPSNRSVVVQIRVAKTFAELQAGYSRKLGVRDRVSSPYPVAFIPARVDFDAKDIAVHTLASRADAFLATRKLLTSTAGSGNQEVRRLQSVSYLPGQGTKMLVGPCLILSTIESHPDASRVQYLGWVPTLREPRIAMSQILSAKSSRLGALHSTLRAAGITGLSDVPSATALDMALNDFSQSTSLSHATGVCVQVQTAVAGGTRDAVGWLVATELNPIEQACLASLKICINERGADVLMEPANYVWVATAIDAGDYSHSGSPCIMTPMDRCASPGTFELCGPVNLNDSTPTLGQGYDSLGAFDHVLLEAWYSPSGTSNYMALAASLVVDLSFGSTGKQDPRLAVHLESVSSDLHRSCVVFAMQGGCRIKPVSTLQAVGTASAILKPFHSRSSQTLNSRGSASTNRFVHQALTLKYRAPKPASMSGLDLWRAQASLSVSVSVPGLEAVPLGTIQLVPSSIAESPDVLNKPPGVLLTDSSGELVATFELDGFLWDRDAEIVVTQLPDGSIHQVSQLKITEGDGQSGGMCRTSILSIPQVVRAVTYQHGRGRSGSIEVYSMCGPYHVQVGPDLGKGYGEGGATSSLAAVSTDLAGTTSLAAGVVVTAFGLAHESFAIVGDASDSASRALAAQVDKIQATPSRSHLNQAHQFNDNMKQVYDSSLEETDRGGDSSCPLWLALVGVVLVVVGMLGIGGGEIARYIEDCGGDGGTNDCEQDDYQAPSYIHGTRLGGAGLISLGLISLLVAAVCWFLWSDSTLERTQEIQSMRRDVKPPRKQGSI